MNGRGHSDGENNVVLSIETVKEIQNRSLVPKLELGNQLNYPTAELWGTRLSQSQPRRNF